MFRRIISLFVIAGLLAGQLAAVPHAHAGVSPAEQHQHDTTPHFHWGWLTHGEHDHGHAHTGGGHSHHRPQHAKQLKSSWDPSDSQHLPYGLCRAGHDSDAVFVEKQPLSASSSQGAELTQRQSAPLAAIPTSHADVQADGRASPRWHPPDQVLDASDTYLNLRVLRI